MMQVKQIMAKLERRYPRLERVRDAVFRGVDEYEGRPYAIRYFDLTDDLLSMAGRLHDYQETLLSTSYFNKESKADLRWNHYLYFVTSAAAPDPAFAKAKAAVEADREYARKVVVTEDEFDRILGDGPHGIETSEGVPPDALSIWTDTLEKHHLSFIADATLQVPAIVRHIAEGEAVPVVRPPETPPLEPAERAVPNDFLASIAIREFRKHPQKRAFDLGDVNLVLGVNGVGKTSFLEAIEYLFCGKTRRTQSVLPRTSISGVLANSRLTLQTKTTTAHTTLRSRHLHWYGKSELRTLTLDDSFSKFNFLDTDAAVRLSVDKSRERIVDDLAQLLLGAEASKALDRFERVTHQLEDNKKTLQRDIGIREARRADSTERLQLLRNAPRESDPLFNDLLVALSSVGWRQTPKDKNEAESLSGSVQSALSTLAVLQTGDGVLAVDLAGLDTTIKSLTDAQRTIEALSGEEAQRKRKSAQASLRLRQLTQRVEALDSLAPLVAAGFNDLQRKRQALEQQLSQRISSLGDAEGATARVPSAKAERRKILSRAVAEWATTVRASNERIDAAKKALAAFERTQSVLSSLRQRLLASAQEIVEHTRDATHCPLCRAEYSEAELATRFELAAHGVLTDESDRLRSELQNLESLREQSISELAGLRTLERYVSDPAKTSLDAAIQLVGKDREQIDGLKSEVEAANSALRLHQEKGWTSDTLIQLASAAGVEESDLSFDGIDKVRAATREEQKALLETVSRLEADAQSAQLRLAEMATTYELQNPTGAELARFVSERRRLCEDRRQALRELGDRLNLPTVSSTSALEAQLREAQNLAIRLHTIMAKERQDTEAIQRETRLLDDAVAELDGLRVKLKRVDSAHAVLQDLLSQQSEQILTETVLRENAAEIASTFAKIHAPNEFDLNVNEGLTIARRGGGNVQLDEMSSGQRAAYALSLFLAMNGRLRTGPKVLLLDDPVAHVDDINILSLLDHLRDIALTRRRQVFFATADAKIGALFARKFRFLGERFKEIELTRD